MLDDTILSDYNKVRQTKNKDIFCHAAFTNMNFEQNGNATACCYNRTHVLGTYPKNTIEEMWYGQEAEKLRGYMRRNILPDGCHLCHMQFESRNFGGLRARAFDSMADRTYLEKDGRFIPRPKMMEFEISNVCNLECAMCNGYFSSLIRKNRENLPPLVSPYDESFVKQLEPFIPHLAETKFLGGEPFLIKAYYQIWDLLIRLRPDVQVSITTNGTILNNRVVDTLEKLRVNMIISIDSLEKENYEQIRSNARFDRVMEHFRYFKDYVKKKYTTLTLAVCPMQQNWKEMPHFLEFCNEQGIYLFFNTVTYPENATLQAMKRDELVEVLDYLKAVKLTEGTDLHQRNNSNYCDMVRQILYYRDHPWPSVSG
jgi:MoaA/NifB/PqqE/SkfB family radical SAM enzyme